MIQALGIDPGIEQTGWVLLSYDKAYHIVNKGTIKTSSECSTGERLQQIHTAIYNIAEHQLDMIACEQVYFNRNVSSALSTAKVIGVMELIAHRWQIPCLTFTPQQAKMASGLGGKAQKKQVRLMMQKLCRKEFANMHESDACAVAIAGVLQFVSAEYKTIKQIKGDI